jgi:hypothetical protein
MGASVASREAIVKPLEITRQQRLQSANFSGIHASTSRVHGTPKGSKIIAVQAIPT